jgi:hypothetical protein
LSVVMMSDPSTLDLWAHIFGDQQGFLALFSGVRVAGVKELQDPSTEYFSYPPLAAAAWDAAQRRSVSGREVYMCAHLLTLKRRLKANASPLCALYVDGDGAQVPPGLPAPTAVVDSSPGRQQFYWRLTAPVAAEVGEQLNRRLAYAMGADKSGWDLTQLLRVPGTVNRKYADQPTVRIARLDG